jgi:hypothetical protein
MFCFLVYLAIMCKLQKLYRVDGDTSRIINNFENTWNKAIVYLKELSPYTQQTEKMNKVVSMADFILKA